jgi:hypothetical protein
VLRAAGIETFESCEGGDGHAFLEPTIRFHGHKSEGFRALAVALEAGLRISELRRVWACSGWRADRPVLGDNVDIQHGRLIYYLPSWSRRAQCLQSGRAASSLFQVM